MGGINMQISVDIENYSSIEEVSSFEDQFDIEIKDMKGQKIELCMSQEVAEELMEVICKKLKGYHICDKVEEMQWEIDELQRQITEMEEIRNEQFSYATC
jgi:predicted nucleic acid-binding protein